METAGAISYQYNNTSYRRVEWSDDTVIEDGARSRVYATPLQREINQQPAENHLTSHLITGGIWNQLFAGPHYFMRTNYESWEVC